MGAKS